MKFEGPHYPHVEFITAETWCEAYDKSRGAVILYQVEHGWWAFDSLEAIKQFGNSDWKMTELENLKWKT